MNEMMGKTSVLFSNIGSKIKKWAFVQAVIGALASLIYGIEIISTEGEAAFFYVDDADATLLGFLILVVGVLLSWVSSFVLYGFGQLIENSDRLVELAEEKKD